LLERGKTMRKVLIYILVFVLLCFLIPIIFTKRPEKAVVAINEASKESDNNQNENKTDTKTPTIVKLLHAETGEVEELEMDKYLYGVVSAEMPANFEKEALKAQAIVARTYTEYKIYKGSKHENADICDDSKCCQAWISKEKRFEKWNEVDRENNWNKITSAVDETSGKIITYDGAPINAFFHSNSGGTTETVANVWGGSNYPYLQSVETSGEDSYTQYASTVTLTKEEVLQKMQAEYPETTIDWTQEKPIQITEYNESGRVKTIQIGNKSISGVEARTIFGLKSAKFNVQVGESVQFDVVGYGHGVGLSQTGADAMAKTGATAEQIINHYYTGVKIENI
jgi:stage II sporulation protein D